MTLFSLSRGFFCLGAAGFGEPDDRGAPVFLARCAGQEPGAFQLSDDFAGRPRLDHDPFGKIPLGHFFLFAQNDQDPLLASFPA